MWAASDNLLAAIAGSHIKSSSAIVLKNGVTPVPFNLLMGSHSNASLGSSVTRTADIVVDRTVLDNGLLNPLTDKVILFSGVQDIEDVPIFTGRPMSYTQDYDGKVNIHCSCVSSEIIGAQFEVPWATAIKGGVADEIRKIIQDVDSSFGVDTDDIPTPSTVPSLVFETDRAKAINDLAGGVNCLWLADRTGGFIIKQNPFVIPQGSPVTLAATLRDGENGTMATRHLTVSREKIFNSITIVVERTDQSPPVRVTVRDTNRGSKTYWGGAFGKQNKVIKLQTTISYNDAKLYAQRVLNQSLALANSLSITLPNNPTLDPGDIIAVFFEGDLSIQVIESVSQGFSATDGTNLTTREFRQIDSALA